MHCNNSMPLTTTTALTTPDRHADHAEILVSGSTDVIILGSVPKLGPTRQPTFGGIDFGIVCDRAKVSFDLGVLGPRIQEEN